MPTLAAVRTIRTGTLIDVSVGARPRRRTAGRIGCAVEATLSVIGGVWKPVILFHLVGGTLRFNAIGRLTPSATPRMITLQLRELEGDGIVRRTGFPEIPPRVEYALTDLGRTLEPVLVSMREWGAGFQGGADGCRPTRAPAGKGAAGQAAAAA